jgi:hypothetical protein
MVGSVTAVTEKENLLFIRTVADGTRRGFLLFLRIFI